MASQWYLNDSGQEVGPLSSSELRRLARDGRIRPDSWVRRVGEGGWIAASRVKNLFEAPGHLPPPQPWALGAGVAGPAAPVASDPLVVLPAEPQALLAGPRPAPAALPAYAAELEEVQPVSRGPGLGLWIGLGAGVVVLAGGLLTILLAVVFLWEPGTPSSTRPSRSRPGAVAPLTPTSSKDVTFTNEKK